MKVFFDTNVYVAQALQGKTASRLVTVTHRQKWRIYYSDYLLNELNRVLVVDLGFPKRLATLAQWRIAQKSQLVKVRSKARVPHDPNDSPILQAALSCGADYLVTNDRHLTSLDPYEGLRIVSMGQYFTVLHDQGFL